MLLHVIVKLKLQRLVPERQTAFVLQTCNSRDQALDSRPFRQGTCASRSDGGQVRYLNGHDSRSCGAVPRSITSPLIYRYAVPGGTACVFLSSVFFCALSGECVLIAALA